MPRDSLTGLVTTIDCNACITCVTTGQVEVHSGGVPAGNEIIRSPDVLPRPAGAVEVRASAPSMISLSYAMAWTLWMTRYQGWRERALQFSSYFFSLVLWGGGGGGGRGGWGGGPSA